MLRELHISGLGVIDDLDLQLDPGLNVLTGETGAGKTMITVGLALALGSRGSGSLVRSKAPAARVQARFDAPLPDAATAWTDEGELVLARSVGSDGKSSVRIGGQIATVGALGEIAPDLVAIHGQRDARTLLDPASHADFLDRFAGSAHLETLIRYRSVHRRLVDARSQLAELAAVARDREREVDLLRYQIREIEDVGPTPGEIAQLADEERRLASAERIAELATAATTRLVHDGGGADALREVESSLSQAAALDARAGPLVERATAAAAEVTELARDLRAFAESAQPDSDQLERVRERMRAFADLRRKYGEDETEMLAFLERARERVATLVGVDERRAALAHEEEDLGRDVIEAATALSDGRRVHAPRLAAAIDEELSALGMPDASVRIALHPLREHGPLGDERVELLLRAGAEQRELPLARTASGGELSRVMLACRSVLADLDDVPTLVFDEVDAGIGGRAGVAVGRRLARLATTRQVLVVTHLPQIASFADRHIRVEKRRGIATASVLTDEERVEELSRMLSGLPTSESAAVHAVELLSEASREKAGVR